MNKVFRCLNLIVVFAMAASLFIGVTPAMAQNGRANPRAAQYENGNSPYVPGELVVGLTTTKQFPSFGIQAAATAKMVGAQVVKLSDDGAVLMRLGNNADLNAAAANLRKQPGVAFVEPNYIYTIPTPEAKAVNGTNKMQEYVIRKVEPSAETENKDRVAIPIEALQSMKKNETQAVYPNDPYLWWNGGWNWVGADILTGNATPSANICEIDTGVDYTHPDLISAGPTPMVLKGYDFVNADANPMDDNGHGTHVAGIMVAVANNNKGIAGVSTGKVVAVKALDAQGSGTNYDIARAINYCANRLDVKVISMSLGGGYPSTALYNAVNYAVNTKGKLVVAAAGNNGADVPMWPAFFSNNDVNGSADCAPSCPTYPALAGKVVSVAASGQVYEDPPDSGDWYVNNNCKADYSNYGPWVSVSAPGTWIYSTLPWDKPFYLSYYDGYNTRYDSLSGTSMATPFVAAAAARRWGYSPLETNVQIGADVINMSPWQTWDYNGDGACWPASMDGKSQVNVAALLDRGAFSASAYDSVTGLPLNGATIGLYQGKSLKGSAIITPWTWKTDPYDPEPTRVYMSFNPQTDVVNLPVGGAGYGGTPYVPKVNKTGYTASPQRAFQHVPWANTIYPGSWVSASRAAVPPNSGNFDVATGWWLRFDNSYSFPDFPWDLDTNVWLPNTPNPLDAGQTSPFIVGPEGDAFGFLEGDPTGALTNFPFARFMRDGGWGDWLRLEDITVAKRAAHGAVAANAALPYYPGDYVVMMTDWGQTIDHDGDGCGDNYGYGFDPSYDNTCGGVGTPGISLLGTYYTPWVYVWKDGVIKAYAGFNGNSVYPVAPGDACNAPWWKALTITSGLSGAVSISVNDQCGEASPGAGPGVGGGIQPYNGTEFTGRMGILQTPKPK